MMILPVDRIVAKKLDNRERERERGKSNEQDILVKYHCADIASSLRAKYSRIKAGPAVLKIKTVKPQKTTMNISPGT